MVSRTVLTYDGLESAPDDGLRRELLGGELYVSPAPSPKHQSMVGDVYVALRTYAEQHGGEAFVSPIDVVFTQIDATQPDAIYLAPDRLSLIGKKYILGAPTLIVEVLSPSSSDVDPERKLETYAHYGVPEYWIVDPATRNITVYAEPSGKRYLRKATSVEGTIEALTLQGLQFTARPSRQNDAALADAPSVEARADT
ncbi:MAG: Uma2 family endonuclease [Candidatus Eremiobacteraeota bacterium]|nr:Uma2 family endonuclease [Candidatus Eremiobacteraeota bacterium]